MQPLAHVLARLVVRGRGERDERDAGEELAQRAELDVLRAEVVAPLRDAVRLVDREERERQLPQHLEEAVEHEALGRDVEQVEVAGPQIAQDAEPPRPGASEELRHAAATPLARNASTWSFMSEMSGETTIAMPGRCSAGIWNVSDLPPPVGMSTNASPPPMTCSTISRWCGRNSW